jgi:hypothetical protein
MRSFNPELSFSSNLMLFYRISDDLIVELLAGEKGSQVCDGFSPACIANV